MTAAEVVQHFKAVKSGAGWKAQCPAHEDAAPSLSITEGDDGRTLMHCHAGCTFAEIMAATDLKVRDFFPPKSITPKAIQTAKAPAVGALAISKGTPAKFLKEVASYIYVNEQGEPRYRVVRYEPKTFKQCRPDPEHPGQSVWGLGGERRLLYHLDKIQGEKAVALVEGEKDADRLIAEGVLATTNSGGSGQWTADHAVQLKAAGIEAVYVVADHDAAGLEWLDRVRKTCAAAGVWVIGVDLPESDGLKPGWDVSDWMDAGNQVERLREMLEVAAQAASMAPAMYAEYLETLKATPLPPDPAPDADADLVLPSRPRIVPRGMALDGLADAAWAALLHANEPPIVFRRGDVFVRLYLEKPSGLAVASYLDRARLRHRLVRVADWRKSDADDAGAAYPPSELLDDMLVDRDAPVPLLQRIVECPVFLADGRLMSVPGFDAESGVLYRPPTGFEVPPVPVSPSVAEVAKAREMVLELFCDFPFVGQADRAAAVALLLATFARDLMPDNCPMTLIEKPTPRTGASLIADSIGCVLYGRPIEKAPEAGEEAEWRKRITSILLNAPMLVVLDNLRKRLDSAALSVCLTAGVWSDRILGENKQVKMPARCLWLATANNPRVSNEIAGRTVPCRLDPKVERPGDRDPRLFKHPHLLAWIREHRPKIVWSCLTLIQRWLADGRPAGNARLGGFEGWCETMSGIMLSAGIPGLLENIEQFRSRADDDTVTLKAFLAAWLARHGQTLMRSKDLVPLAEEADLDVAAKTDAGKALRLGKLLKAEEDRRYNVGGVTVAVKSQMDPHDNAKKWWLVRDDSRELPQSLPQEGAAANTPDSKDEESKETPVAGVAGMAGVLHAHARKETEMKEPEARTAQDAQTPGSCRTPATPATHARHCPKHPVTPRADICETCRSTPKPEEAAV